MNKEAANFTDSSPDLVRLYLRDIAKYELLTREQEVELSTTYLAGVRTAETLDGLQAQPDQDGTLEEYVDSALVARMGHMCVEVVNKGDQAKELLINSNLRLVVSIAKQYKSSNLPLLDLIQEGTLGLTRSIEKFDPGKGFKISTYATRWIRQAIARAIDDKESIIRIPTHRNAQIAAVNRAERKMKNESGICDDQTIAEQLNISPQKLRQIRGHREISNVMSLNKPLSDDGTNELGDLIADQTQIDTYNVVERDFLFDELWKNAQVILSESELDVLALRFGLEKGNPHTLEEIGQKYGFTRERARQIEQKALNKFRASSSFNLADLAS